MSTTEQSVESSDWKSQTIQYMEKMAKLKLWTGTIAAQALEDAAERQDIAIRAEDAAVRQSLGYPEPAAQDDGEPDGMGRQTILGDVTQSPPVVVVNGNDHKPVLGTLAAIALGMALPGAGLLGAGLVKYLGDRAEKVIIEKGSDTITNLGLKRIGDLELGE